MLDDLKKYFNEFLGPVLGWTSYVITIVTVLVTSSLGLRSGRIDPKFLACLIPFLVWIVLVSLKHGVRSVGLFFLFCGLLSATLLSVMRLHLISYEAIQFTFAILAMVYFSLKTPASFASSKSVANAGIENPPTPYSSQVNMSGVSEASL